MRIESLTFEDEERERQYLSITGIEDLKRMIFSSVSLMRYACDALEFACFAENATQSFWEYLLSETFVMEREYAVDQADVILYSLYLMEQLNADGIHLPKKCFQVECMYDFPALMTEACENVIAHVFFSPLFPEPSASDEVAQDNLALF